MQAPEIRIYNSLGREKQALAPLHDRKIGLYVCGMTVYDDCHLGHARMLIVFDAVVRYLRARGFGVRYVRNITDIDDKIIRRAMERRETWQALVERYIGRFHEDAAALGLLAPDAEPRATEHIPEIVAMIRTLLDRGYAYRADNGDVYYSVGKFSNYGRLAGQRPEDLLAGARIEPGEDKREPLDFALWKARKPGEPAWPSPWGEGRPGWHIECSAMSVAELGAHFDLHGGGLDLKFPHHENEIAQSESATGERFVNVWMHNGFVEVNAEKMAKSLGNFLTVRDLLERWNGETLRFFVLASHYRSPLAYSEARMGEAHAALSRLYLSLRGVATTDGGAEPESAFARRFHAAMSDDFNTPEAIAALFDLAREINRRLEERAAGVAVLAAELRGLGGCLGLLQEDPDAFLRGAAAEEGPDAGEIERLLDERQTARKARDFERADRIRAELAAFGVVLEDTPDGTLWRRA